MSERLRAAQVAFKDLRHACKRVTRDRGDLGNRGARLGEHCDGGPAEIVKVKVGRRDRKGRGESSIPHRGEGCSRPGLAISVKHDERRQSLLAGILRRLRDRVHFHLQAVQRRP